MLRGVLIGPFINHDIKFVIGHRRNLSAKRLRGPLKGGLNPLGSSDDGMIESPPPLTRGGAASCQRLRVLKILQILNYFKRLPFPSLPFP